MFQGVWQKLIGVTEALQAVALHEFTHALQQGLSPGIAGSQRCSHGLAVGPSGAAQTQRHAKSTVRHLFDVFNLHHRTLAAYRFQPL